MKTDATLAKNDAGVGVDTATKFDGPLAAVDAPAGQPDAGTGGVGDVAWSDDGASTGADTAVGVDAAYTDAATVEHDAGVDMLCSTSCANPDLAAPIFNDAGDTAAGGDGGPEGEAGVEARGDAGSPLDLGPVPCVLRINEIQTGAPGASSDEFIELWKSCPTTVSLAGWKLVYRAAASSTDFVMITFSTQVIPAERTFWVVAHNAFSGPGADVRITASMAAAGGGVALVDAEGMIVDSVGWGTATNAFVETKAALDPFAGKSIARVPDGDDTDNNNLDFEIDATPSPGATNE